jgi:hypothetical protein
MNLWNHLAPLGNETPMKLHEPPTAADGAVWRSLDISPEHKTGRDRLTGWMMAARGVHWPGIGVSGNR